MNDKRNELQAGLFIIVTVVLTVTVILLIHGVSAGPTRMIQASWKLTDDIGGLRAAMTCAPAVSRSGRFATCMWKTPTEPIRIS